VRERSLIASPAVLYGVVPLMGAGLIAASAQLAIPWQPVPLTLQVFAVVLLGFTLGPRLAAIALTEYLVAGFAGLPVFAQGYGGLSMLSRASTGYLFGFWLAAPVIGLIAGSALERGRLGAVSWVRAAVGGAAGLALIYGAGALWLANWLGTHSVPQAQVWATTWNLGVKPFLFYDAAKIAVAAVLSRGLGTRSSSL
jgi:biotin transport system substrate-specific component